MNLWQRLVGLATGLDEGVNALGGGSPVQTVSGTVGRAVIAGKWWGKPLASALDALFGKGHCVRMAAKEEGRS